MLRTLLIGPRDPLLAEFLETAASVKELDLCHHLSEYVTPSELTSVLAEVAPDAVAISLADYNSAARSVNRLIRARPDLQIIALHTSCDQQLLIDLMQLGVRELWFPPFGAEQMQQSVVRLALKKSVRPASEENRAASIFAFLPARGGAGTTTIAVHTALALDKIKGATLLADFDFHNSIIAFWMKIDPRHGFQEALERAHWLDSSQWKGLVSRVGALEVLTAPQMASPLAFSGEETSAVLEYARQNYNFVLVDLPEAIYSSCWEVLEQADQIFMTSTPEMASLYLARRKLAQLTEHGIPRGRIRILLSRSTHLDLQPHEVEKFLSLPVAANFANHYRAVTEAIADGAFIPESSKLGTQYLRFAESLAGVREAKPVKAKGWNIRQLLGTGAKG